jgi:hypothetical protein
LTSFDRGRQFFAVRGCVAQLLRGPALSQKRCVSAGARKKPVIQLKSCRTAPPITSDLLSARMGEEVGAKRSLHMLNRISVSALLKSVIGSLGVVVVIMLAMDAWSAWKQYRTAIRSAAVIDVSRNLFTGLHNLRVDRSTTLRGLAGAQLPEPPKQMLQVRAAELAALKPAIPALEALDFPNKQSLYPALVASLNKLTAMHAETARATTQPREQRRPELAKEFGDESAKLLGLLDKLSEQLTAMVKLDDAMIDQLLALKQLAWLARNSAGDAQLMVSNAVAGLKMPPDAMLVYTANLGKTDAVWAALEDASNGMKLPPQFQDAMRKAKAEFFDPAYSAFRLKVFKAALAGEDT